MRTPRARRALVAVEALVLVLVLGMVVAFLAVGAGEARRRARVGGSINNLQRFAAGAGSFAADNEDRWFSFSWHRGETHVGPDGFEYPAAPDDNIAAVNQAVSIIRERAQRPDITPFNGWAPHVLYNYLPLVEYLGLGLPAEFAASPSDQNVLAWQRAGRVQGDAGEAFLALRNRPGYPGSDSWAKRSAYASSYRVGPAFYSPDAMVNTPEGQVLTYEQSTQGHFSYVTGSARTVLGARATSEVRWPANKVMMFEGYADDRSGRRMYYAYERARTPSLFADGSISVRSMSDANRGFLPNSPNSPVATWLPYRPDLAWEPPTVNGTISEFVWGGVQWTRSGLRGRDFGGAEVAWVP